MPSTPPHLPPAAAEGGGGGSPASSGQFSHPEVRDVSPRPPSLAVHEVEEYGRFLELLLLRILAILQTILVVLQIILRPAATLLALAAGVGFFLGLSRNIALAKALPLLGLKLPKPLE